MKDHEDAMATLDELGPTISIQEAGRLLGLSRTAGYRTAKRCELPTITLSGRIHARTRRLLTLLGIDSDPGNGLGLQTRSFLMLFAAKIACTYFVLYRF